MALTNTTLTSAITAFQLKNLAVTDTTGFADKQLIKIDAEYMFQVGPPSVSSGPGAITVRMRGAEGTPAVPHDVLAGVATSASPNDFPTIVPGAHAASHLASNLDSAVTIGQDLTFITLPNRNTTYLITKGSAAAITLISGTPAQLNVRLTFISESAFAHVITYAGGFLGGLNTVATLTAKVGASLVIQVGTGGVLAVVGGSDNVVYTL